MELTQEDRAMIINPALCTMWLATYAEPGHFEEMGRLYLRKCGQAASRLLNLGFGLKESAEWPSDEIKRLVLDNLERVQEEFRKTGHNADMDQAWKT